MARRLLLILACCALASPAAYADEGCVILLHGLGRTASSLGKMEDALVADGYRVWNESYPSTSSEIETLAPQAIEPGIAYCRQGGTGPIHFVTHSLGGILVRYYLNEHDLLERGRIVMLSPPNRGSEIVDVLGDVALYQWVIGPAGQQLGTGPGSVPNSLGPIGGEIGIITGTRSYEPWFSPVIPGEDDGKVSVESARLDEMTGFLTVEAGHTFIMRDPEVIRQVKHFLRHGEFTAPGSP